MNDDIVEDAELEHQFREEEAAYHLAKEKQREKEQTIPIGAYECSADQAGEVIEIHKKAPPKSANAVIISESKSVDQKADVLSKTTTSSSGAGRVANSVSRTSKPNDKVSALLDSRPYATVISPQQQKLLSRRAITCGGMSLILDGLPVLFPFPHLYTEQYRYMYALKQSLDAKGHALLEMPTGTGMLLPGLWGSG